MRQQEHHMRQEKAAEKTARSLWVLMMACFNAGERFNCIINALNKLNMVFENTNRPHRASNVDGSTSSSGDQELLTIKTMPLSC
ncbi:hypothetical protein I7I50_05857 [Histoplasma capsulatum G186AR]|uniref:Uncharacterized protein n=1 Tax=Ajellomyces capsulatus TaxID=5037 RepID=A0A8H7Z9X4_AJECA|nr:hypothetical protein I7I52_04116 [Histoplasma capsulatum]QSS76413.1 hypothetical protein I7I50_05857 [Histoplasma capsulatum G186AR]